MSMRYNLAPSKDTQAHTSAIPGSFCQIGAYAVLAPAGPFPLMCFGYLVIGVMLAIQAAQATGYVASLKKDSNAKMGYLHGS